MVEVGEVLTAGTETANVIIFCRYTVAVVTLTILTCIEEVVSVTVTSEKVLVLTGIKVEVKIL